MILLLALCCLISGNVHAASGAPLAGARIAIHGGGHTSSDALGVSDARADSSCTPTRAAMNWPPQPAALLH